MIKILLLYLFWGSFALIGFAEIKLLENTRLKVFSQNVSKLHSLSRFLVYFLVGLASLVVVVLPLHVFELGLIYLKLAYFGSLLASVLYFGFYLTKQKININFSKTSALIFAVVAGFLLFDLIQSNSYGGIAHGDIQFELARITQFRFGSFGLKDAMFGDAGIATTIYSANIFHSLHALAGDLLNMNAAKTWYYTHGLVRILIFLGIFTLSAEFLKGKTRYYWSYAVLVLVPLIYNDNFLYAQLHYTITLLWGCAFILGLKWWLEGRGSLLLIVGAILLATSHPLSAFIAFSFVTLLLVTLFFAKKMPPRYLLTLFGLAVILLTPILVYYYYPHSIAEAGFNDSSLVGSPVQIKEIAGVTFNSRMPDITWLAILTYSLFLSTYLIAKKYVKKIWQKRTLVSLVFIGIFLTFNLALFSLAGLIYLLILIKNTNIRLLLILLASFGALVAYNPIILSIALDRFPLWTISRFYQLNVLAFTLPIIASMWLVKTLMNEMGQKKYTKFVPVVTVLLWFAGSLFMANPVDNIDNKQQNIGLTEYVNEYSAIEYFKYDLKNKIVFSNNENIMSRVPTVADADILHYFNEANVHPNVHFFERKACSEALGSKFEQEDIIASKIEAVLVDGSDSEFLKKAESSQNLEIVKSKNGYSLFFVTQTNKREVEDSVCYIPETLRE